MGATEAESYAQRPITEATRTRRNARIQRVKIMLESFSWCLLPDPRPILGIADGLPGWVIDSPHAAQLEVSRCRTSKTKCR